MNHPTASGYRLGTAQANIKYRDRSDLVVIRLDEGSQLAAVFTQNTAAAAPVVLSRQHLASNSAIRALIINSGVANAGTGDQGLQDALACCQQVSALLGLSADGRQVLPFSTGVILQPLPMAAMTSGLNAACANLGHSDWPGAADAIMTTDTYAKHQHVQVEVASGTVNIHGISKGAGMICPNMATMLAFIACDAEFTADELQQILDETVADSFNAITIDGDTSTNDACVLMASGKIALRDNAEKQRVADAIKTHAKWLAEQIVLDGEGATKQVRITVEQAHDSSQAKAVAYSVANSPLVKTAFFASDPNLGRVLAAVGNARPAVDCHHVDIYLNDLHVIEGGTLAKDYDETSAKNRMCAPAFEFTIRLHQGKASFTVLTCDLSYEYIRINADYRS